nr:TerB family tellurite resistance protein [Halorubellus salinus]
MGCHQCNRSRLWGLAGKNLLLGWWSIASLFANPFTVLWNLGRGAVNRGPTTKLARTLAESGVDFRYLADASEFDASDYGQHELLQRGLLRLGVAVMVADGHADPSEAAAIRDNALELFPDADRNAIEGRVTEYANATTNAAKVADGLAETLTRDGRQLALRFAAQVAVADGDVDDAEAQLLATMADELELDDGAVQNAIGSGVSTETAPDPSAAL